MAISRETARRRTTLAKISALALAVGAGAVVAIEPGLVTAPPPPDLSADTADQAGGHEPPAPAFDTLAMASTIEAIGRERVPPPESPKPADAPGTTPDSAPTAPPPSEAGRQWKYIGSVVGPRSSHAMVTIGGRQRLVAAGAEHDGVRLMAVEPDQIVVDDHGTIRTIKMAPRSTAWPNQQTRAVTVPRPGVVAPTPPSQTPEEFEREQAERQRMLMEEMERARQKSGASGAPAPGAPMRPTPLPAEAAGLSPGAKGIGGAGSRH